MKRNQIKMGIILLLDMTMVFMSYLFSYWVVANFRINFDILDVLLNIAIFLPIYMITFLFFKLESSLWRFASVDEAIKVIFSTFTGLVGTSLLNWLLDFRVQGNVLIIANVFVLFSLGGLHFSFRLIRFVLNALQRNVDKNRTLIVGAGQASTLLIKEIRENPQMNNRVLCLVDDDLNKLNKMVLGVKVVGMIEDIEKVSKKYAIEEIIVAIPSASKEEIQRVLKQCETLKVKTKILPPFYEIIGDKFNVKKLRDVQIEDLLGREPVRIDPQGLSDFINDEVVLVTGGGGSIGSELCRQIVKYHPRKLIILDIYENNAYEIQNELLRKNTNDTEVITLIASIRDEARMIEVFETYRPTVVFHAAAHKHVPLMEDSPKEAIKNNIFGTHNVVKCSDRYKVKKFVLISTDKAVNPTNIMGASKRFAEMIIQAYNNTSQTQFAAVRFGNVLGSNGSVIPLFKHQIAEGGPVTVTHKDIIRYFMTIPEAVQLVLQAGAFAKGGEIFVLDMGEPVKILHLAEQLIRLSGYEPYKDIDIKITGLRPGEKLYEELLMDTEGLTKTENKKIFILTQVESNLEEILHQMDRLKKLINRDHINIQDVFGSFVSTYHQPEVDKVPVQKVV